MQDYSSSAVGIIFILLGIFIVILWIFLPFAVFGVKDILNKIHEQQQITNDYLISIINENKKRD